MIAEFHRNAAGAQAAAFLIALAGILPASAQDGMPPANEQAAAAQQQAIQQAMANQASGEDLTMEEFAYFIINVTPIGQMELDEEQEERFLRGFRMGTEGTEPSAEMLGFMAGARAQVQPDQLSAEEKADLIEGFTRAIEGQEPDPRLQGFGLASQLQLQQLGFTEEEIAEVNQAIAENLDAEADPARLQNIQPKFQAFMMQKQQQAQQQQQQQQQQMQQAQQEAQQAQAGANEEFAALQEEFIENLEQREGVQQTESGLYYEIQEPGDGPKPSASDTVRVHYTGELVNGRVFDSSRERGEPATFPLNRVIAGWTEGLQLIGEGGRISLYVPSDLGYGDRGNPPTIPGGAMLIFDVELLEINPMQ